jgi:hypothetical protein
MSLRESSERNNEIIYASEALMRNSVSKMESILNEEKVIYSKILEIERQKGEAISEQNGEHLERYALDQAQFLERIDELEIERESLVSEYVRNNRLDDLGKEVTLKEILLSMDEDSSRHLMRIAMELKTQLIELQKIKETHDRMLNDNMEFYNILLSGLKKGSKLDSSYGSDGKEDEGVKAKNPLLFNQTA